MTVHAIGRSDAVVSGGVVDAPGGRVIERLRSVVARSMHAAERVRARSDVPDVRIARVFDGCDDGRPWFAASHPCVAAASHRARLLDLLRTGEVVFRSDNRLPDLLTGTPDAVCADLRSDGVWVWSEAIAHYLERHRLRPDRELTTHLLATPAVAVLARDERARVRAALTRHVMEVTTWSRT